MSWCAHFIYASSNASFFPVAPTYRFSSFGVDGARHLMDRIVACRTERTFETGANGARRLRGQGNRERSEHGFKRPLGAPRIGSVQMRRFVWLVAECLEASRPVKSPDCHFGIFICVELSLKPRICNGGASCKKIGSNQRAVTLTTWLNSPHLPQSTTTTWLNETLAARLMIVHSCGLVMTKWNVVSAFDLVSP